MVAMDTGMQQQQQQEEMDVDITAASSPSNNGAKSAEIKAKEWKQKGNAFFSLKKLPEAVEAYQAALKALEEGGALPSSSSSDVLDLATVLRTNLAQVFTKMRRFQQAEQETSKALEMDPGNIKALFRRAFAREGQFFESNKTDSDKASRANEFLLPAIDDVQKALGLLDEARSSSEQEPATASSLLAKQSNQSLTRDCQRLLDRLEKEYNENSSKMAERNQQRSTTSRNSENPRLSSPPRRQRPRPENVGHQRDRTPRVNGSHTHSNTQQESRAAKPQGTLVATAAQQKKDVTKLLLARQAMLQRKQSSDGSHQNAKLSSSRTGEAFFLLEWNWWVQWCRYVDFFYLQMRKKEKEAGNEMEANTNNKRILQVLSYLPPGAELPLKPRPDPKSDSNDDDSSEDDDSDEEDIVEPPGPIDNSILLVDSSDRFYHQWYSPLNGSAANNNNNYNNSQNVLKPNLVRGYHFELVPREVYQALHSWYGETTPALCRRLTADYDVVLYSQPSGSPGTPSLAKAMIPRIELPRCNACRAPGSIRKCKHCMSVHYCDRACQESHWPFHKRFCKEIVDKVSKKDENESVSSIAESILPRDSNGRVGLNQLGNTCYMNSVLQSLSHASPLTRFFLSGQFKADLNRDNPIGAGGKIALAYETVMRDLWMKPEVRAISPVSLKRAISLFAPRFAGCHQHDAPEFLAFLLDGLHEDLNRIRDAPYVEMPDVTNGQNMAIAAAEAWDAHKRRNDSLVMDTFYGQFQSTCICPQCNKVSVSFDAFNHVSLEIPQRTKSVPIAIPVLVHFADGSKPIYLGVTLARQAPILELKKRVAELSRIPLPNLLMAAVYGNSIYTLLEDRKPVSSLDLQQDLIVAYETEPNDKEGALHVVVSHCLLVGVEDIRMDRDDTETAESKSSDEIVERKRMGIPFIAAISTDSTCNDVYRSVWKSVRRMVVDPSKRTPSKDSVEEIIDANGHYNPEDLLTVRVVDAQGNPRELFEEENEARNTSILPKQSTTPLSQILGSEGLEDYLFLSLEWKNPIGSENPVVEKRFVDFDRHSSLDEALRMEKEHAQENERGVTLDQCFQSFSKPERLDENNMWYCSRCKDHVRAMKTMKLWRIPNILVVHLKRFEFRHGFRRDKLDTYVDFPFEKLDMDPYTVHWKSASEGDQAFVDNTVPAEYDLFAVVNHYGRMGFGHYTAFAMPWDETGISREWSLFDDSSVQRVQRNDIRTAAAYILFYRRRQFN